MTTTASRDKRKELALELVDEFAAFMPAFAKWIKSSVKRGDLTFPRMRLLYMLNCYGPQIMTELSAQLGVSPRNITTLVDALERDGKVKRRPHPTDRRATFIELTAQGAEDCSEMYSECRRVASDLFSKLSENEQGDLLRVLSALRSVLQSKGIASERPGGACIASERR